MNRCRELGADILINYRDSDFVASLAEATDNHGADVVLDNMGASYLGRNVDALAMDGHVVIIGMQGGRKGEVDIAKLMGKRGNITSTGLRGRPLTGPGGKADIVADVRAKLWPLIADGSVQPIVSTELPITERH